MTSTLSRMVGCAVAASGVAFAAQHIHASADSPDRSGDNDVRSRALIVDAGSGYSRAYTYRTRVSTGLPVMAKKSRLTGANLVQIIQNGQEENFIAQLEQLREEEEADRDYVPEKEKEPTGWFQWKASEPTKSDNNVPAQDKEHVPVIVGATAGIRIALETEEITQQEVNAFAQRLAGRGMQFQLLTEQREAELELRAAQFCFGHTMPHVKKSIGIFSAGGMSAQIVSDTHWHSLPFELKTQNRKIAVAAKTSLGSLRRQIERDTPGYFRRCVDNAKASGEKQTLGEPGSVFVALEMIAWVGDRAGLGDGKLVPVGEAKAALSAFALGCKETVFRAAGKQFKVDKHFWRLAVPIGTALEAVNLMDMMDPESLVFFSTEYEVGGAKLKPQWALAVYLDQVVATDE